MTNSSLNFNEEISFFLISGTLIFLNVDVFGRDSVLMKLEITGDCARCNFNDYI